MNCSYFLVEKHSEPGGDLRCPEDLPVFALSFLSTLLVAFCGLERAEVNSHNYKVPGTQKLPVSAFCCCVTKFHKPGG